MYSALIFDLDGTIINTENMWADATKQMLTMRGINYTNELRHNIHNKVHGLPPITACALLKEMLALPESPEELAKEKAEQAYKLFVGNIHLISGFTECYKQAQQLQFKMAIATNCHLRFVELADSQVQLRSYFNEHIYCPDHVNDISKPDPTLYLHAAQQLEVNPAQCIAIEDSAAGIQAAKKAGMYCIGINTAQNRMNLADADEIVENYAEIHLQKFLI